MMPLSKGVMRKRFAALLRLLVNEATVAFIHTKDAKQHTEYNDRSMITHKDLTYNELF
jgi:hypothetical protein